MADYAVWSIRTAHSAAEVTCDDLRRWWRSASALRADWVSGHRSLGSSDAAYCGMSIIVLLCRSLHKIQWHLTCRSNVLSFVLIPMFRGVGHLFTTCNHSDLLLGALPFPSMRSSKVLMACKRFGWFWRVSDVHNVSFSTSSSQFSTSQPLPHEGCTENRKTPTAKMQHWASANIFKCFTASTASWRNGRKRAFRKSARRSLQPLCGQPTLCTIRELGSKHQPTKTLKASTFTTCNPPGKSCGKATAPANVCCACLAKKHSWWRSHKELPHPSWQDVLRWPLGRENEENAPNQSSGHS